MKILKERTRLIFSDYTDLEHKRLEDKVASMDNIYMYVDEDKHILALPTGMEATVKKMFPNATFEDKSDEYWPYDKIQPVQHEAKPRNQLQIDFINFVLKCAKEKKKLAGILSPGSGKSVPISTKLPAPNEQGYIMMKDIKIGDELFTIGWKTTKVIGVYPQGTRKIYKITLEDGRTARCDAEHLWSVYHPYHEYSYQTLNTEYLYEVYKGTPMYIPCYENIFEYDHKIDPNEFGNLVHIKIINIEKDGEEESQCIKVDDGSELFVTENSILTHNTFMACYSAISIGDKTLIIVPTSAIKAQWVDTLVKMFNVPAERVKGVSGPKDFINCKADFVVVSHATLASINKTYDLEKIMYHNRFGIKVIDEVQMWFKNIIQVDANSNIANNWYITGTFGRSGNKENELYQEMFGDLEIFREEEKKPTLFNRKPGNIYGMKPYTNCTMLWTNGGLTKEQIKKVTASMRYSEREGKWIRFGLSVPMYTEMTIPSDGHMTKFLRTTLDVIKMAERKVKYGSTLVLVGTIDATEVVASYITKMFPDKKIGTYHSRNTKDINETNKKECDILVSTVQSAGTGFDKKGLGKLIVASVWRSWVLSLQVFGRLRRRDDGKDCYMWEIVDSSIPQLRAWANVRADVYKRASKSFKVIDYNL